MNAPLWKRILAGTCRSFTLGSLMIDPIAYCAYVRCAAEADAASGDRALVQGLTLEGSWSRTRSDGRFAVTPATPSKS